MQNFWENKNWEKQDKHLIDLENRPFRRPFPHVQLQSGVTTLRGPRQIGKSSLMKTILLEACQKTSPGNIIFESCENIENGKELHEWLQLHRKKKYIFLDEVTFVKEWSRPIKHLIDSGYSGTIVVTGSHVMDLRQGVDRMPGREGLGEDILLLPMNFWEYQSMRKQAGWSQLSHQEELEKYFHVGGFPIAVTEAGASSSKVKHSLKTIEKWILGDVVKAGKNELYAKDILSQVALTMGSTMSLQKLAQRTQVGSHHTVSEYLNMFEDMFVLRSLYSIDPNTGAYRFKKEKKYYLTDPLILRLALHWVGLDDGEIDDSILAEMVAHEFLRRKFDRMGFLTSSKGGEVDFYQYKKWAIEIKWTHDIKNLSKTYKDLILPYKKIWGKENFLEDSP